MSDFFASMHLFCNILLLTKREGGIMCWCFLQGSLRRRHSRIYATSWSHREVELVGSLCTLQLTQQLRYAKRQAAAAVQHYHNATPKTVVPTPTTVAHFLYFLFSSNVDPYKGVAGAGQPPSLLVVAISTTKSLSLPYLPSLTVLHLH